MSENENPVNWFEIYVDDMERAKDFYSTVLNKELAQMDLPEGMDGDMKMVAFPMIPGAINSSGALVKSGEMKPGTGGTLIYFSCEDCSKEESRVEGAGGKVLQPKYQIGEHGYCSICMDTEGNTFGLYSN